MKTIANKKGNTGFTAQPWNFHRHVGGGAGGDFVTSQGVIQKSTVAYCIRHVQVHSCGKKVMRLFALDEGVTMRGREFKPDTPIYADAETAEAWVRRDFRKTLPELINNDKNMVSRYKRGVYGEASEWVDKKVAAHTEVIARLTDGRIPLEIVYFGRTK